MDLYKLSHIYQVRQLNNADINAIYELCTHNPMYYRHCPPFVTKQSIGEDMCALPPHKTMEDKFFIGYFDGNQLIAVMDLILQYPNKETAFIGFFMMNQKQQGKGIGTQMIEECAAFLKNFGCQFIRLGFAEGNPQSEAFWTKNKFIKTGDVFQNPGYTVVVMQRTL